MEKKPLLLGEEKEEDILEGKGGAFVIGPCILCDTDVWSSQFGYGNDNPVEDIPAPPKEEVKCLHKDCYVELLAMGPEIYRMMKINSEYQKKN